VGNVLEIGGAHPFKNIIFRHPFVLVMCVCVMVMVNRRENGQPFAFRFFLHREY